MSNRYTKYFGIIATSASFLWLPVSLANNSELIKNIKLLMDEHDSVQGEFVQEKKLAGFSRPVRSSGVFQLIKSKSLKWQITSPIESLLLLDMEQGSYLLDGKTLSEDTAGSATVSLVGEIVIAVFESDWEKLEKYFTLTGEIDKNEVWSVTLVSRSDVLAKVIEKIRMSGDRYVKHITISDKSQDETHIQFLEVRPLTSAPE